MLIGAACIGIILIIIGGSAGKSDSNKKSDAVLPDDKSKYDIISYSELLEKKIKQLCESVNGVSNVSVAVTLNSGFEYVYAVNQKSSSDAGDNNTITEYLIIKKGSEENVVYITGMAPQIKGVGIVCTNGSNENVKYEIINLVSAAFDVKKSKIYVSESKNSGKK